MEKGSTVYSFTYDPAGRPVSISDGSNRYYYVLNQQGDVIGLLNSNAEMIVMYVYDAWGRVLASADLTASGIGTNNPLRYRGYVYDTETGLYYLQSRYYNPTWGRFINADSQLTTKNATGVNLFAYCYNNPVMYADPSGLAPEWWQWAISGVMFLTGVALIATGFGSSVGGVLVCASTNSIVNSYLSEAAGGSSTAGWLGGMITGAFCGIGAGIAGNLLTSATNSVGFACLGKTIAGHGAAFGFGVAGSYAGQITSAAIEGKTFDEKKPLSQRSRLVLLTALLVSGQEWVMLLKICR
jgi:RHS repeat-associated protein